MSFINSIKNAGRKAIRRAEKVGSRVVKGAEKIGSSVGKGAKKIGGGAVKLAKLRADITRIGLEQTWKGAKKAGSTVAKGAKITGKVAVKAAQVRTNITRTGLEQTWKGAKKIGSGTVKLAQFQADVTRIGLEQTWKGAKKVGGGVVKAAQVRIGITRNGLQKIWNGAKVGLSVGYRTTRNVLRGVVKSATHPGDSRPPAAQGLNFSQTKGASMIAHKAKKGSVYRFPGGAEWKVIDVKVNAKSGFRAIALKSNIPGDKRVVVAYGHTVDKKDWITNVKQGAGLAPKQYREAAAYAKQWKAKSGNNVILTGDSLGGGLASYASIKSGLRATAINSAPLSLNNVGFKPSAGRRITQYYVPGEVLTVLDIANSTDIRPGKHILVEGRYSILKPNSVFKNHYPINVAPETGRPEKIR